MDITAFYTQGQLTKSQANLITDDMMFAQNAQSFALLLDGLTQDEALLAVQNNVPETGTEMPPGALLDTPLDTQLTDVIAKPLIAENTPEQIISIDGNAVVTPNTADISVSEILLLDGAELGVQPGLLARLTDTIKAIQNSENGKGVLFNLTPEQITQLQNDIATLQQTGELPEAAEGFGFVLIQITPPTQTAAAPATVQDSSRQNNNSPSPAQAIIESLALLRQSAAAAPAITSVKPEPENKTLTKPQTANVNQLSQNIDAEALDGLLDIQNSTEKFTALLKQIAAKKGSGKGYISNADFQAQSTANNPQAASPAPISAPTNLLEGWPFTNGSLLSSLDLDTAALQALGLNNNGQFQVTGLQDLMNVTTQARQAGQPHPGTALVAASFGKAMANNGNQTVTLYLDPPELGRVEVRMEFGADKSVQTKVVSEKHEAHLMLQRDAQVLERALQELGLDGGESTLEFSMAQDGQDFGQDGRHDGSRNAARGMETADDDLEIVESTMNWHVDPKTGHMHYNILV